MGTDGSVAPKERINIKYVPATNGQQEEVELPLRMVVMGDFYGRPDNTPLEERQAVSVDKNNFVRVMEEAKIEQCLAISNRLSGQEDESLQIKLNYSSLADFEPDSIARQVPELRKLLELREALVALKGPLGNMPAFRQRLQQLLNDGESRQKLLAEIHTGQETSNSNSQDADNPDS